MTQVSNSYTHCHFHTNIHLSCQPWLSLLHFLLSCPLSDIHASFQLFSVNRGLAMFFLSIFYFPSFPSFSYSILPRPVLSVLPINHTCLLTTLIYYFYNKTHTLLSASLFCSNHTLFHYLLLIILLFIYKIVLKFCSFYFSFNKSIEILLFYKSQSDMYDIKP